MRTRIIYLFFLVFVSLTTRLRAQDDETLKYKVEQLEAKKERVAGSEREALKNEVEIINNRFEAGEITKQTAQELKKRPLKNGRKISRTNWQLSRIPSPF